MSFPVPFIPDGGYGGSRGFGADRSGVAKKLGLPSLLHGACDLVASPGTPVLAVDDGFVMYDPVPFFGDKVLMTYEFAIRHDSGFVARYCEIDSVVLAHYGDKKVKKGQVIAYIGDQPGTNRNPRSHGFDMLHFEMYTGKGSGSLSTSNKDPKNGP